MCGGCALFGLRRTFASSELIGGKKRHLVRLHRLKQKMSACNQHAMLSQSEETMFGKRMVDQRAHATHCTEKSHSNGVRGEQITHSQRENHEREQQTFDISFNAIRSHNFARTFCRRASPSIVRDCKRLPIRQLSVFYNVQMGYHLLGKITISHCLACE